MLKVAVRTEIVLVLVAVGIVLAACGGGGTGVLGGPCPSKTPPAAQSDGEMTVEDLTDLVAEAMTCPGYVIHLQSIGDYETGDLGFIVEFDAWVDVENNVARTETVWRAASEEALRAAKEAGLDDDAEARTIVIYLPDARYTAEELSGYPDEENQQPPPSKGRPASCNGVGREALGALITCPGPLDDWETTVVRNVSFENSGAIALLTEGESSDSDSAWTVESWLYFDADSLLPLGGVNESTGIIGGVSFDIITSYENGFVSLDSLPADFFGPESIGYLEKDPEEPLDSAEIAVYWLGSTFEGGGEYPALALDYAVARPRAQTLEFNSLAEIVYRPADDEFGRRVVRLGLYPPESWEFWERETQQNLCEETVDLDLPGIRATLRRHYHNLPYDPGAPCPPPDRFSAAVYIEDILVRIDAPSTGNGRETFRSPYDSEAAMELLVRSLVLRE